jgi:RNA polymerase sigma-70 factor
MLSSPQFDQAEMYVELFNQAQETYGNLGLGLAVYTKRLNEILRKYLSVPFTPFEVITFFKATHTDDLYLTTACAEGDESAWQQFDKYFRHYILQLAKQEFQNPLAAQELTDSVVADMFFSDKQDRPRIASYQGQATLCRWLRMVVSHQAADERKRKYNHFETLDVVEQAADDSYLEKLESQLRTRTYQPFITAAFRMASQSLSLRERMILLMKYDELVPSKQIAKILDVHPSRVTQILEKIRHKLKREVISILTDKHRFTDETINECMTEVVNNPEYSLMDFLKAS